MSTSVPERKGRYCTPEQAAALLRAALNEKQQALMSADTSDYEHAARIITFCMMDYDQDYGMPILRSEVTRVRENISHVQRLLERLIERIDANVKEAALDSPEHAGFPGMEADPLLICDLERLRDGLEPYLLLFHADLRKRYHWHVYADHLFDAFKFSVPPRSSRQPWGLSPEGPAVRFIGAALQMILVSWVDEGGRKRREVSCKSIVAALARGRTRK